MGAGGRREGGVPSVGRGGRGLSGPEGGACGAGLGVPAVAWKAARRSCGTGNS